VAADVVDWDLALKTGSRLAPSGPDLDLQDARLVVDQLRVLAVRAEVPVRECTGLVTPTSAPPAVVVDRHAWIESNINSFRYILDPILEKARANSTAGLVPEIGSRITGVQLGSVLAWMSGKVLGQYEALVPPGDAPRLMLVAPNIVKVAAELEVDQRDFQMWVALHEETHRVQFNAVPWLSGYFASEVRSIVVGVDMPASEILRRGRELIGAMIRVVRGTDSASSVLKVLQSPSQREAFDRITAMMTLLEGHADVVMDEVGPQVVPSVELIRERFTVRRTQPGAIDSVIRRVLGMDEKLRQYSEGALFVRGVTDKIGMAGFNRVWESPTTLPTLEEIANPAAWIRRIDG